MSDGQYKVNLIFEANTTLAQKNLQELGSALQKISHSKIGIDGGSIDTAVKSAQQLQIHLQNALNVNTGKLDLSKLDQSLTRSKTSLSQLTSNLQAAGPAGEQAFLKIAMAIQNAETPAMRMSETTKKLINTLGNTVKWQISSKAIHAVSGAISESIGYIEKFDKALTDIRMVSDLNNDQLMGFVENTKKIAKEVNATSLEIAQGATIFFQQGLSVDEVEKRIAVTQKMANVTRESTATVASQLTSIWNNFATGSETLESFADKIAYLGAKTAADTNQIANAMQKFSAAANTVGLSYDYAATMVAEVVDRTQISAEVVGTAFNTILSRMQGLQFGDTLDDGVTLNKYSEALETVGVDVLDMNNNLKDADTILQDLGAKWQTLDEAEKKALATTVAGVRQQTSFIALMEEWDDVEATVGKLGESQDYLNKRNAEYAQSLEGIKDQFAEAKNQLFDELLNEDMLKGFYKAMTSIVKAVTQIVDNFGGLMPMILTIAALLSKTLIPMITAGARNLFTNVMGFFGFTENKIKKIQNEFNKEIQLKIDSGELDETFATQLQLSQALGKMKSKYNEQLKYADAATRQLIQQEMMLKEALVQEVQSQLDKQKALKQQSEELKQQILMQDKVTIATAGKVRSFKQENAANAEAVEKNQADQERQEEVIKRAQGSVVDLSDNIEKNQKALDTGVDSTGHELTEEDRTRLQSQVDLDTRARDMKAEQESSGMEAEAFYQQKRESLAAEAPTVFTEQEVATIEKNVTTKSIGKMSTEKKDAQQVIDKKQSELDNLGEDASEEAVTALREEIAEQERLIEVLEKSIQLKKEANRDSYDTDKLGGTVIDSDTIDVDKDTRPEKDDAGMGAEIVNAATDKTGISYQTADAASPDMANFDVSLDNLGGAAEQLGVLQGIGEQVSAILTDCANATKELDAAMGETAMSTEGVAEALDDDAQAASKSAKATKKATSEKKKSTKEGNKEHKLFGKLLKSKKNLEKQDKKSAKTTKQTTKTSKELTKTYGDLAKKLLGTEKGGKALADLQKKLENVTDEKERIAILTQEFEKMKNGVSKAGMVTGSSVESMLDKIEQMGPKGKAALDQYVASLQKSGQMTPELEARIAQLYKEMETDAPISMGQKIQGALTSVTQFAGAIQGLQTGMEGLITAFDADSFGEGFLQFLSSAMMLLPTVSTLLGIMAKMKDKDTEASKKNEKQSKKSEKQSFKETIANAWAAAGNAMKALSKMGPWGWVIGLAAAAAIVAAIGMGVAAGVGNINAKHEEEDKEAEEQAQQAAEELAETKKEAAEAAKEEADQVKESTQSYIDLYDKYKKTGEGREELIKKGLELADQFDDESMRLAVLRGDYQAVIDKMKEYSAEKTRESADAYKAAASTTSSAAYGKLQTENDGNWKASDNNEGIKIEEGTNKLVIPILSDDGSFSDVDAAHLANFFEQSNFKYWKVGTKSIYTDPISKDELGKVMVELEAVKTGYANYLKKQNAKTGDSLAFGEINEALNVEGTKDALDTQKTYSEEEGSALYYEHVKNPTSATDFLRQRDRAMSGYDADSAEGKAILAGFDAQASAEYSNYSAMAAVYDSASQEAKNFLMGPGLKTAAQQLKISEDEAMSLYLSAPGIDLSTFDGTEESLKEWQQLAQGYLDEHQLTTDINLKMNSTKLLKEDMSDEDWTAFFNQAGMAEFLESKGMTQDDFKNLSFSEQKSMFNMDYNDIVAEGEAAKRTQDTRQDVAKNNMSDAKTRETDASSRKTDAESRKATNDAKLSEWNSYYEEYKQWLQESGGGYNETTGAIYDKIAKDFGDITSWEDYEALDADRKAAFDKALEDNGLAGGPTTDYFTTAYNLSQGKQAVSKTVGATKEDLEKNANEISNDLTKATNDLNQATSDYEKAEDEWDAAEADKITTAEKNDQLLQDWYDTTIEAEEFDADQMKTYTNYLEENTKGLKGNHRAAQKVAIENERLNKGVETLSETFEEYGDDLSNVGSINYAKGLEAIKDGVTDLLGVEGMDTLSDSFYTSAENMALFKRAADGDSAAIEELQRKAAQDIIVQIAGVSNVDELSGELKGLSDWIVNNPVPDLEVGVSVDSEAYVQNLFDMLQSSGRTVEEMNEIFDMLRFDPEIEYKEVEYDAAAHQNVVVYDPATGQPIENKSEIKAGTKVLIPSINTKKTVYMGNADSIVKADNKKGGDSSPAEKVDRTKKSDVVNRYEEIEDKLDDIKDAADRASSAMNRLYGADKLKAMREQNQYLQEEVDALKEKRKQAEEYLKEDTKELAKVATEAGVRFEFDEMGNVTNYTEQMTRLYDQLAAAEGHMDGLSTKEAQDEYQETNVQPIQDAIDALKEGYETYENSRESIEDLDKEIQEAIYAWQDSNAEILNYEIELQVEMDERELQKIEYYLTKMEDDFYSAAESAALIGDKVALTEKSLQDNENNIAKLKEMYEAGEISQSAYVEGLKNEESKMYANLQTLQELDDTMQNYYGETLAKAQEELDEYTEKMDNTTSVLDHYKTLLDLTGQSQNFKAIGTVLEGQAKTIENSYQVAKQNYEWLADEAIKKKQAMNEALARGDTEAAELFGQEWKNAEESMRESQEEMLSQAESWAEKLAEILENRLSEISSILEDAFTGGKSFDELSMQMEHAQSIQEEYLTTTNKIYETNKMIRNAQNEIDKTTNTVAKQKLKAFQQETQQMQNQGQLSQFELDIQQQKYDLLLAEIALEEAQNAKSTVRLQRDSEGNFGYVYTADQNQISGAEQGVEDAENALYNTRLEGANNYASQRQELLQGLYDSLTNLDNQYYIEGTISEEEYNRQKEAIQSYYFEKMGQNSELYSIATGEDATVAQEAWSTSLGIMDMDMNDLVKAVDDYLTDSSQAFSDYQTDINRVAQETGVDLDNLASNVQDITDESDELKNKVKDEVLPELQKEVDKVSEITSKYALHRGELDLVMKSYEDLLTDVGNVVKRMADLKTSCDNVKTSANQAASAVGNLATIQARASAGQGGNGGYVYTPPGIEEKKPPPPPDGTFSDIKYFDLIKWEKPTQETSNPSYFKTKSGSKTIWIHKSNINAITDRGVTKYYVVSGAGWYNSLPSYDTGGYTGEWGPEGKLAWLHQKELILNADQTEDLLMTMELLDNIVKQIDLMSATNKISQMAAAANQAANALYKEQVAQEVHIEANFPNATDRNEIAEALALLANDASQFINR